MVVTAALPRMRVVPTGAPHRIHPQKHHRAPLVCLASSKQPPSKQSSGGKAGADPEVGPGLKAVWYAAEQFGKLVSGKTAQQQQTPKGAGKVFSREEAIASIRADYDQSYFVSGVGEMAAYAQDCTFSDPFVSFKGTERFKQNVGNLGALMSDIKLDVYGWEERAGEVQTRWRFSCLLDLPWKPRIAAAGNTTHVLDATTGQVVQHIEAWEVEPGKVVRQLFRPAAKVPTNAWETFFMSASEGDGAGVWFSLTPLLLRASAPVIGLSLLCKLATGEGLPGPLHVVEVASSLTFLAASVTEVIKFAQGMQGGETGTGGRF